MPNRCWSFDSDLVSGKAHPGNHDNREHSVRSADGGSVGGLGTPHL